MHSALLCTALLDDITLILFLLLLMQIMYYNVMSCFPL